jgi:hypothetical protein
MPVQNGDTRVSASVAETVPRWRPLRPRTLALFGLQVVVLGFRASETSVQLRLDGLLPIWYKKAPMMGQFKSSVSGRQDFAEFRFARYSWVF